MKKGTAIRKEINLRVSERELCLHFDNYCVPKIKDGELSCLGCPLKKYALDYAMGRLKLNEDYGG